MTITFKTITKMLSIAVFTLLFFSSVSASEINSPLNEYDSTYRHSIIENMAPFPNLENGVVESDIQLSVATEIPEISFDKKLQNIIDTYNFSKYQIDNATDKINNTIGLVTVLVGNNLGILKFQVVQINNQISELKELENKTNSVLEKDKINSELKILTEEYAKVSDLIIFNENKFSLFGWFVVLL